MFFDLNSDMCPVQVTGGGNYDVDITVLDHEEKEVRCMLYDPSSFTPLP